MPIQLTCGCGQKMQVKEEHAGKRTKCPACGTLLDIPAAEAQLAVPGEEYAEEPRPSKGYKRTPDATAQAESGGVFAPEKKMVNGGIIVGLLLMAGAVAWFVLGIMFLDRIFFYPPIMFILGIVSVCKGILNLGKPQDD